MHCKKYLKLIPQIVTRQAAHPDTVVDSQSACPGHLLKFSAGSYTQPAT